MARKTSKKTSKHSVVRGWKREPALDADEEKIREWATPRQVEALDALARCGTVIDAAETLGITPGRLRGLLSEARRRAASQGWSPHHDMVSEVPGGFHVRGVSTYYGKDGEPRGQWVKSQKDQEHRMTQFLDACEQAFEPFRGKSPKVKAPRRVAKDTLSTYIIGDAHIGMLAWGLETLGEDFDLKIAEEDLVTAMGQLVALAPPSDEGLIINVGDWTHSADSTNMTRKSGHILDTDSRWTKMMRVAIRVERALIELGLQKHKVVRVRNAIGNHDEEVAIMLGLAMEAFYHNNPRVIVETSPAAHWYYEFGNTLFGVTHGDKSKPTDLGGIMANDQPQPWGRCKFRRWVTGHVHHLTRKEVHGCIVETFRTLAPGDAWHSAHGYRAGREMVVDVTDREHGFTTRHSVGISQVRAIQAGKK